METKNQKNRGIHYNDTNEEITERGYTVRDGHNPDKPNPYERNSKNEISEIQQIDDDFHTDRDLEESDLDNNGNVININDELDNPSDEDFEEEEFEEE